jgi:hypothetical protein
MNSEAWNRCSTGRAVVNQVDPVSSTEQYIGAVPVETVIAVWVVQAERTDLSFGFGTKEQHMSRQHSL